MGLNVNVELPSGETGTYLRILNVFFSKTMCQVKVTLYKDLQHRLDGKPCIMQDEHGFPVDINPLAPGCTDPWMAMYAALKTLYPGSTDA